ncbi:MAG: heparinase II/III family protein [Carboxylicivirga sp.]|nr:heparinase II/III family protein [Carboxylicivirga sp.]
MQKILLLITLLSWASISFCIADDHLQQNFLEKRLTPEFLKANLITDHSWVPYPAYHDREGWDKQLGDLKDLIIRRGEEVLDYEWKVVTATDYLNYDRIGGKQMYGAFFRNREVFNYLILAELAEGRGRFLDQILNGVWNYCEMSSWAIAAHIRSVQRNKGVLPYYKTHGIGLAVGDIAASMAWTYYFFKDEFDKVNPIICERIKENLEERIFNDYMAREDYWWMAIKPETTSVNNWNVWINSNVMLALLLVEDDTDKLVAGLSKVIKSVDGFIRFVNTDGACEEGPTYWDRAGGKLYDCLQILDYATKSRAEYWDFPLIKNLGEYIAKSYIGDAYVVNFADASPKGGGNSHLIYRYGKAIESDEMMQFAAYLYNKGGRKSNLGPNNDLFRCLETITLQAELAGVEPALSDDKFVWYPETEFCYMRAKEAFLASKGGFNAESHNHNDAGTFLYYLKQKPLFIDVGVGTYTKQTFSSRRYEIWTMQSQYHNLPIINGYGQRFGTHYKVSEALANKKKSYCTYNVSGAYDEKAKVDYWKRSYHLSKNGDLTIKDDFALEDVSKNNEIIFMLAVKPELSSSGQISIKNADAEIEFKYDAHQFDVEIEDIELKDKKLIGHWGNHIYRLHLIAKKTDLKGTYAYQVKVKN